MNIDIHLGKRHLEKQQRDREDCRREDIPIGLGQRMLNESVAKQTPIHKCVDRISVQLLDLWFRYQAVQAQAAGIFRWGVLFLLWFTPPWRWLRQTNMQERFFRSHRNHLIEHTLAKNLIHPLAESIYRRCYQHCMGSRMQLEVF